MDVFKNFRSYLRIVIVILFLMAAAVGQVFAATYNECNYGEGSYNIGCSPSTSPSPTSSPSSSGSSDSHSAPGSASPPGCSSTSPSSAPWLYGAVAQNSNSILLYFSDAGDPVDTYALTFGVESGNYQWGMTNFGSKGTRTYLVQSLQPNTKYYFRVRGGNGCATGEWSNEISATTWPAISLSQLQTVSLELEPEATVQMGQSITETGGDKYEVNVMVTDKSNQPLHGAVVTLHPQGQETATDAQGNAYFKEVEAGEHTVNVSFDGSEGEQSIYLSGSSKVFDLNISLNPNNPAFSPPIIAFIIFVGFVGLIIMVVLIRSYKK